MKILYLDRQIYDLIPQRPPMLMVDAVLELDNHNICTALTIVPDNIFCDSTHLEESGLIEHIAQTAACLAGYETITKHLSPRVGYIGEIKNFACTTLPTIGQTVYTCLEVLTEIAGVTLIQTTTTLNDQLIARCQMKIFIPEVQ